MIPKKVPCAYFSKNKESKPSTKHGKHCSDTIVGLDDSLIHFDGSRSVRRFFEVVLLVPCNITKLRYPQQTHPDWLCLPRSPSRSSYGPVVYGSVGGTWGDEPSIIPRIQGLAKCPMFRVAASFDRGLNSLRSLSLPQAFLSHLARCGRAPIARFAGYQRVICAMAIWRLGVSDGHQRQPT